VAYECPARSAVSSASGSSDSAFTIIQPPKKSSHLKCASSVAQAVRR
jgi:hypothetical protein